MFKQLIVLATAFSLFAACSDSDEDLSDLKAVGGVRYGGEFRFMSPEKVSSLLPIQSVDVYTQRITSQLFDPLLKLDPSGRNVIPSLAESYTISQDATTFTFKIRKGVYFHDDECFGGEGRELTAEDVKFTLDMACSGLPENEVSWLLVDRIKGAKEFNSATRTTFRDGGVSGIKVQDNQTLIITLTEPFASFDKVLTYSGFGVFPREAYDLYGKDLKHHPVGTGPFMLDEMTPQKIVLKRNPRYWRKDEFGNQLPFLASIVMTYATDKRSELMAFRNQKIDLVLEIPADDVENVLGSLQEAQAGKTVKHKVDSKQSLSITFFGLSHTHPAFRDVRVRRALNMAVDREAIVNTSLKGEGYPVTNGIIPNSEIYPASRVKGFRFDPVKARALMAEAGYADGAGFPVLTIYVNGKKDSDRHLLAKGFAEQMKTNLNIDMKVRICGLEERNEAVSSGKAAIWVSGWIADYPDAENFLSLFYGGNIKANSKFVNPFKYKNPQFDRTYLAATREPDPAKRLDLMVECDQMVINDAVVIPMITDDFITMINSRIRDFETNPLEVLDFSAIFIKEPK
jgi:peptide/nickel transport system substrate-binding protein